MSFDDLLHGEPSRDERRRGDTKLLFGYLNKLPLHCNYDPEAMRVNHQTFIASMLETRAVGAIALATNRKNELLEGQRSYALGHVKAAFAPHTAIYALATQYLTALNQREENRPGHGDHKAGASDIRDLLVGGMQTTMHLESPAA